MSISNIKVDLEEDRIQPRKYVDERFLEQETGRSTKSWQRDRLNGSGPPFIRCGGKILYDWEDFQSWMSQRKVRSTSEALEA